MENNNELKGYSKTQNEHPSSKQHNPLRLLSISKAASSLGIGRETLRQLIADGKIGIIKIGKGEKISIRELERFLDDNVTYVNNEGKLIPSLKTEIPKELQEEFNSINIFNKIKGAPI